MPIPPDKPIRIFILDPYALIRAGLRSILEAEPGMTVVGEAGNSSEGLEMVACQKPDIILLKLNNSGDLGLDVIHRILETWSQTRIILLTTNDELQTCIQAVQNGVLGVVSVSLTPQVLLKAIQKVFDGEIWIEHAMMAHVLNNITIARRPAAVDPETEHIGQLSDRERQVIQLIGEGLKNKQIAAQLCISEATVRHHLTSIFNKLGVSDRLELLVFAHRSGLTKEQSE